MKKSLLNIIGAMLLCNFANAEQYVFDKDDPFIVISQKRAEEIVRAVKRREAIELIFGKGHEHAKNSVSYSFRSIPNVEQSGFAGLLFVEYDVDGNMRKVDVSGSYALNANLVYPNDKNLQSEKVSKEKADESKVDEKAKSSSKISRDK